MPITKEQRQEIIEDFAKRHGGKYNPGEFLAEVEATGEEHPAYEWFEWDNEKASREHRLWQARQFVQNIKISFRVETASKGANFAIREATMPLLLSPMTTRHKGGGYVVSNPNRKSHIQEFCQQAADDLARWLRRYESAVLHAGGSVGNIRHEIELLERATEEEVKPKKSVRKPAGIPAGAGAGV